MKATTFTGALLATAFATGCATNAQTGAATGAAGGAILGGIIGHNTGHSTTHGAEVGAMAGALAGAAIGHHQDKQAEAIRAGQGDQRYVVQSPPPAPTSAPYEQVPPRPSRDSVWVAGYHDFVGGAQYQWMPGHWETPPPGARSWVNPMWQPSGNGYTYGRGHWQ